MADLAPRDYPNTSLGHYASPQKSPHNSRYGLERSPSPTSPLNVGIKNGLNRATDSQPNLGGPYNDAGSRRSGAYSMTSSKRLNQSTDILRPLKAERSLMNVAGTQIMGRAES